MEESDSMAQTALQTQKRKVNLRVTDLDVDGKMLL